MCKAHKKRKGKNRLRSSDMKEEEEQTGPSRAQDQMLLLQQKDIQKCACHNDLLYLFHLSSMSITSSGQYCSSYISKDWTVTVKKLVQRCHT